MPPPQPMARIVPFLCVRVKRQSATSCPSGRRGGPASGAGIVADGLVQNSQFSTRPSGRRVARQGRLTSDSRDRGVRRVDFPHGYLKKTGATRCDRVAPFSIESQSFRFPFHLAESGSVLPWPPPVKGAVKLYFLDQLTITTRFHPCRIFECAAKTLATASVQQQLGLTLVAANSAAKRTPLFSAMEAGSVLPLPSPLRESRSLSSRFNSVQSDSVLPSPPFLNCFEKFFLPDQSVANTKSGKICWQELFRKNTVENCACLWKKIFKKDQANFFRLTRWADNQQSNSTTVVCDR
jgi:hypothetical protein